MSVCLTSGEILPIMPGLQPLHKLIVTVALTKVLTHEYYW